MLKFHYFMKCGVAINAKEGYCWYCIVFDVTLHIISLIDSAYRAHLGIKDSSLYLLSIPIFTEFKRQCLLSPLERQSWVLTELTQLMKESLLEPMLIELIWLPKEDCTSIVLIELTQLPKKCSVNRVHIVNIGRSFQI